MNNEFKNNASNPSGKPGAPRQGGQGPKNTPPKQNQKKNKNSDKPQNNIANTDSDMPMTSSEIQDFYEGSDN